MSDRTDPRQIDMIGSDDLIPSMIPRSRICPECQLHVSDTHPHQCAVPRLLAAIGVELSEAETRTIHWLAGTERCTIDSLVSIFAKVREQAKYG